MTNHALVLASLFAFAPALAQPAIPAGPGPADPMAAANLSVALDKVCAPFLQDHKASAAALARAAAAVGYELDTTDPYGAVGQPIPDAPPPIAVHKATGAGEAGADVVMFLTTVPTACQIRVKGDAAAWSTYLATMSARRGTLIASATLTPETTYSHEVYTGGVDGLPAGFTLFVNRWVGTGAPKGGVYTIINVLPDR